MDDDTIPISALNHYLYCPRRCALIHMEQTFAENVHTLRGNALHENADEVASSSEDGVQVERALPLYSDKLGLVGKADVVEFHAGDVPYPVEYKQGRKETVQQRRPATRGAGNVPRRNDGQTRAQGGDLSPQLAPASGG